MGTATRESFGELAGAFAHQSAAQQPAGEVGFFRVPPRRGHFSKKIPWDYKKH